MTSRLEEMIDSVVAELQNISTVNGFRTNPTVLRVIRDPNKITSFPEIGIEVGAEELVPIDDKWTTFDTLVDVYVQGAFMHDTDTGDANDNAYEASMAMQHDIKRIVAKLFKEWLTRTSNQWNISKPNGKVVVVPLLGLGEKENIGIVSAYFKVKIRTQDEQFQDPSQAEVHDRVLQNGTRRVMQNDYDRLTQGKS